jgi:hypothetical protein
MSRLFNGFLLIFYEQQFKFFVETKESRDSQNNLRQYYNHFVGNGALITKGKLIKP